MKHCPKCGQPYNDTESYCAIEGAPLVVLSNDTCWFCSKRPARKESFAVVHMHSGSINTRILIPRCAECCVIHKLVRKGCLCVALSTPILVVILAYSSEPGEGALIMGFFFGLMAAFIVTLIVLFLCRRLLSYWHLKMPDAAITHPEVKAAINMGYKLGSPTSDTLQDLIHFARGPVE